MKSLRLMTGAALLGALAPLQAAQQVALQNATSTWTQGMDLWGPANTIDGVARGSFTSWGIGRPEIGDGSALPETIVWETVDNIDLPNGGFVKFTLCHGDFVPAPDHNTGRFRLSYTTDDRSLYADGLGVGGAVAANWVPIRPLAVQSDGGETMFMLRDRSVLVQGGANRNSSYTVLAKLKLTGITGFRLDVLEHPTLPFKGPGRQITNGNMHLSEFKVELPLRRELRPGTC